MEALLESLTLHKGNEKVVESVAFALKNICINGISFVLIIISIRGPFASAGLVVIPVFRFVVKSGVTSMLSS